MSDEEYGTIPMGDHHPAADNAFIYVKDYIRKLDNAYLLIEAFASTALSGNKTAEYCGETLRRILTGQPISDRYLLGLAWTLKEMEDRQ